MAAHVVAHAGHDVPEVVQVVVGQGIEQQAAAELDVAGNNAFDEGPAVLGEGDSGRAVVRGIGAAGDECSRLTDSTSAKYVLTCAGLSG